MCYVMLSTLFKLHKKLVPLLFEYLVCVMKHFVTRVDVMNVSMSWFPNAQHTKIIQILVEYVDGVTEQICHTSNVLIQLSMPWFQNDKTTWGIEILFEYVVGAAKNKSNVLIFSMSWIQSHESTSNFNIVWIRCPRDGVFLTYVYSFTKMFDVTISKWLNTCGSSTRCSNPSSVWWSIFVTCLAFG